MAEIAAGALVAEQIVSTTLEGGAVAGYAIAKPTLPLKATFRQFATAQQHDSTIALARAHHTLNVVGERAYIFGGDTDTSTLAPSDIHAINLHLQSASTDKEADYACYPAVARDEGGAIPAPRSRHASCIQGHQIAFFGGCHADGQTIDERCVWIWDTETLRWHDIHPSSDSPKKAQPSARYDHKLFAHGGHLVLYGGRSAPDVPLHDVWIFDATTRVWIELPAAPIRSDTVGFADGTVFHFSKSPSDGMIHIHVLEVGVAVPDAEALTHMKWQKVVMPSEAPSAGPEVRAGAALLPISTGYGRQYFAYVFGIGGVEHQAETPDDGKRPNPEHGADYFSDLWIYQIPSKSTRPASWKDFKPAAIKDVIRDKLGYSSGVSEWAEAEILTEEEKAHEGKVHPGPRAFFGAGVAGDAKTIVLWGGLNAKGEHEADGWLISLQ